MTASNWCFLTGEGPAAIAVARLSGPAVADFLVNYVVFHHPATLDALHGGMLRRANLTDPIGNPIDDMLVLVEAAAPSWLLQLHLHGGTGVTQRLRALLTDAGFVEAAPPDNDPWNSPTRVEREALALLPQIATWGGARWMLRVRQQLPNELRRALAAESIDEVRSILTPLLQNAWIVDALLHPARVAICGPPNAGKSTLINALTDQAVSLVSDRPGTTRDWVEAAGRAGDFPITWIDTAGMRIAAHGLEAAGIERTRRIMREARFSVAVLDVTEARSNREFINQFGNLTPSLVAWNKCDIREPDDDIVSQIPAAWRKCMISTAARDGQGIESITETIARMISPLPLEALGPGCVHPRQVEWVETAVAVEQIYRAREALVACLGAVSGG
jgi:small GTP-binding protein